MTNKQNESAKQAELKTFKLIEILSLSLKKKLRKEFNRVQKQALESYIKDGYISDFLYKNHQNGLENIALIGFSRALNAGYFRLMYTFLKNKWIKTDDIFKFKKQLDKNFKEYAEIQSKLAAESMAKTTISTVNSLIKKFKLNESNSKELNSVTDLIKKAFAI